MKIRNSEQNGDQTFWVSYADLMAGLMFVFMLIIGAVVVKYVLTQSDLVKLQSNLKEQERNITISQNELKKQEKTIQEIFINLNAAKSENRELVDINQIVKEQLEATKAQKDKLESITSSYENRLDDANKTILDLSLELSKALQILNQKEIQINELLSNLKLENSRYSALESDYNDTKNKIKNISLLRSNVISNLKDKLGSKVNIDPTSGVVALPDSILFDTGSYKLKESSKEHLKEILQNYFEAILNSEEILKHIDKIVIEGHTNSIGSYLYNLDLSQKRAYEVLQFIYSWNKDKRLEGYLMASGRSFSDLVIKDGVEDAEASKRIEIKISFSDKEAMQEIEKFLEQQNRKYSQN
ncbi:OmpA family protein [Campylobacter sp. RM16192]|uniref:OmpA family protein n=1 Tax=Campylobacter sp. RM16192 TaxID=1660080 RepID=UPI00145249A9|nr:OmpA family protein [Campylobacter sp. RM16192]QCD52874.1 putative protein (OmpA/MotB domain) [Campylobacter sp. RM16192]